MLNDVRCTCRLLFRSPGFSVAATLTLALGIGATTAIFTLIEAILLRPLPIGDPARVVALHVQEGERLSRTFSYSSYLQYREQSAPVFETIAASGMRGFRLTAGGDTRLAQAAFVTDGYFEAAGVAATHGRTFAAGDHAPGAEPVAVLTDAFWRARMGGDPAAIGQRIRAGNVHATVIGVVPRGFRGLQLDSPMDMFLPMATVPAVLPPANYFSDTRISVGGRAYSPQTWIGITARVRPGVSIAQAEAYLATIDAAAAATPTARRTVRVIEASRAALAPRSRADTTRFTTLLGMVVALVLLVGCANLAGLILARHEERRREAAVRRALGAGRSRLIGLFMLESLLLSVAGGLGGPVVAAWMIQVMSAFVIPGGINLDALQLGLTTRVLLFTAGAALFTTVLTGLLPALAASRVDVVSALKTHGPAARSRHGLTRSALVVAQVAISLVLLVTGAVFVRSLRAALTTDVGMDSSRLAYASVGFLSAGYDEAAVARFYDAILERLRPSPGVERVTFGGLPLVSSSGSDATFWVDGVERRLPQTLQFHTGPDYFATLGMRLVAGRAFGSTDTASSPPVAIVNKAFAKQAWPGQDPVGHRLTFLPLDADLEVIGIAPDGPYASLSDASSPGIFLPWHQNSRWARLSGTLIVRTDDPAGAVGLLRSVVGSVDSDLPITSAGTMEDRIATLAMTQRLGAAFLSWFSALALALAVLGVYGLIAHAVARRTNEIGVRLALGAERRDIVVMTMCQSFMPVGMGIAIGMAGAYVLTRLASAFLFGVAPHDLVSFTVATLCLVAGAAAASYIPARRAGRLDPMAALRTE
jgi:predicted permease